MHGTTNIKFAGQYLFLLLLHVSATKWSRSRGALVLENKRSVLRRAAYISSTVAPTVWLRFVAETCGSKKPTIVQLLKFFFLIHQLMHK